MSSLGSICGVIPHILDMLLTQFTDYGLRVLLYLTGVPADNVVTTKEIASQFNVPQNHLNKIVNRMSKLGWVQTTPGRNGGLSLHVIPAKLLLGNILQALEGHPELIDCDKSGCVLRGNCHLKHILDQGLRDFYIDMNRYSLADLVKSPTSNLIAQMHFKSRP